MIVRWKHELTLSKRKILVWNPIYLRQVVFLKWLSVLTLTPGDGAPAGKIRLTKAVSP